MRGPLIWLLASFVLGLAFVPLVSSASADGCPQGAKAGFARVQLWKDAGCAGGSVIVGQEADDNRPDFSRFRNYDGEVRDIDDTRSSVGVAAGYCVRLFDGRNYTGASSVLICGEGAPGYRDLASLDDRASSMKVCAASAQARCAGATPAPTPSPAPAPTPPPAPTPAPAPPPPPRPNGAPAGANARLELVFTRGRTRGTIGYGRRTSATATLTAESGAPVVGAVLQVFERELRTGTQREYRTEVTTGPDGRARVELPRGTSRTVQVQYRATSADVTPVATATVRLGVRAGVTIRLAPSRVRPGRRVRVSGTLLGAPRPPKGKVVVLQAFDRGRWRTFATARAGRTTGRYALHYRFGAAARGSFKMRVQVRVDAAYPYGLGYSSAKRVRVGR